MTTLADKRWEWVDLADTIMGNGEEDYMKLSLNLLMNNGRIEI